MLSSMILPTALSTIDRRREDNPLKGKEILSRNEYWSRRVLSGIYTDDRWCRGNGVPDPHDGSLVLVLSDIATRHLKRS